MAALVQQYICYVRLQVPEQYKTVRQYEEAPHTLMAAQQGMTYFYFRQVDEHEWMVRRR